MAGVSLAVVDETISIQPSQEEMINPESKEMRMHCWRGWGEHLTNQFGSNMLMGAPSDVSEGIGKTTQDVSLSCFLGGHGIKNFPTAGRRARASRVSRQVVGG